MTMEGIWIPSPPVRRTNDGDPMVITSPPLRRTLDDATVIFVIGKILYINTALTCSTINITGHILK